MKDLPAAGHEEHVFDHRASSSFASGAAGIDVPVRSQVPSPRLRPSPSICRDCNPAAATRMPNTRLRLPVGRYSTFGQRTQVTPADNATNTADDRQPPQHAALGPGVDRRRPIRQTRWRSPRWGRLPTASRARPRAGGRSAERRSRDFAAWPSPFLGFVVKRNSLGRQ